MITDTLKWSGFKPKNNLIAFRGSGGRTIFPVDKPEYQLFKCHPDRGPDSIGLEILAEISLLEW
jgi:hypothetical protein